MAKQKGRKLLIKIGNGATPTEVFTVLCGLTSKTMTINNNEIDVTTADCTDPGGAMWTEVLAGAKRVSVSGNGLFKDEAAEATLNTLAMDDDPIANFQVIVPDFGTFRGGFFVSSVEYGGEQEGGVTYSLALASTGAVTFTAA
ncbi:phage major tail protein, TP901-1 family [Gemmobacter nanjingensis]|uniref:Phage major tail protein, TP901-1 family n=1 Tax=Gemmobacter nanjingensis TaxID=488454 RepID=A0ABQ3F7W0_9RHOB|nr:phage major tail protein, TP901-1 family [Gemmobacter nanjingensis]GHC12515.1 phage major tail protein, TP901-1 family [Gemmobacter nanjingensis]